VLEVNQRLRHQFLPHHEDLISAIEPPGTVITQTGAYNPVIVKSSRYTNIAEIFLKH
jgi:hypothetical protein